ncbi:unnamed protein product [Tilletia controversa]|nr:unnamed protein product [Tilletia controversa]
MVSTAYENSTEAWQPGFGGFNLSESFGWSENGMREHVFTSNDNSTIILAIKGTSPPFFPGGTDTVRRDKENDNLLFSCCCARVSWTWSPVCDCYSGTVSNTSTVATCPAGLGPTVRSTLVDPFLPPPGDLDLNTKAASGPTQQCGQTCLERALVEKSVYYSAAMDLYNNISYIYPDSQIWITGHLLGGSLSALLGMTFGVPTVTFEAPGERMGGEWLRQDGDGGKSNSSGRRFALEYYNGTLANPRFTTNTYQKIGILTGINYAAPGRKPRTMSADGKDLTAWSSPSIVSFPGTSSVATFTV